jgi:hypothetical protein
VLRSITTIASRTQLLYQSATATRASSFLSEDVARHLLLSCTPLREWYSTAAQADDAYELITERAGKSPILTSNRAPAKAHMFAPTCAWQQLKHHGFAGQTECGDVDRLGSLAV